MWPKHKNKKLKNSQIAQEAQCKQETGAPGGQVPALCGRGGGEEREPPAVWKIRACIIETTYLGKLQIVSSDGQGFLSYQTG